MITNITKINNIELVQNVRETTTSTTTTQTKTTTTRTTAQTTAEETTTVTLTTLPHFQGVSSVDVEMTVGKEYKVEVRGANGLDFFTGFEYGLFYIDTNEFDESIAKFDEKTGIITALAPGKTSISFRSYYNGNSESFYITVFPSDNLLGDANCDGKVTIADATAVIQHLGNKDEYALSEQGELNADVVDRGDGVTGADANAVQAIEAGFLKQTDFPIAKADFDALMKNN